MLDKSVPYHTVIMTRPKGLPQAPVPGLPEGYAYAFYGPGDDIHWASLETSVNEFASKESALQYFRDIFLPFPKMLSERMAFVVNPSGAPVATATAWLDATGGEPLAQLHWVSVHPAYQRKGFGRAIVLKALSLYPELGPSGDIWLSTQTWSHPAIDLYLSLGFIARKTATLPRHKNDFDQAAKTLARVLRPKAYARMMLTAK